MSLGLQFVQELTELVEIDTRPEAEGMRNNLRRGTAPGRGGLAQAGANRPIDGVLERDAEFARALLQEARQVVVERQGGAHARHH